MAAFRLFGVVSALLLLSQAVVLDSSYVQEPTEDYQPGRVAPEDVDLLEFPLNLEYLEAEFFLWSALGYGLDAIAPDLVGGGPPPVGAQKANLDPFVLDVVTQLAYQEVGHIRAIRRTVPGFPRPRLDLSSQKFAALFDSAFNQKLNPPFNPYANGLNYLLAVYVIPYVGLTGYVGTNPSLVSPTAKRVLAGLLGVESGQDAVVRTLLYTRLNETVVPYTYTVAEFTNRISSLRNSLGHIQIVDEGLLVPPEQGAEGKISGNVLAGDLFSLSFNRNARQILRIVYSTGNESLPGGFYPDGGRGKIALGFLQHK